MSIIMFSVKKFIHLLFTSSPKLSGISIDIDGNDFWVLKNIELNLADIVVAEYNPLFGPNLSLSIPQNDNFDRNKFNKIFF